LARNSNPAVPQSLGGASDSPLVRVLLIEDDSAEARFLQEILRGAAHSRFQLHHVTRLGVALEQLATTDFDVALLDLTLPDSAGLDSLDVLLRQAPTLPVVVLTNTNDDDLAVDAVRHGAQDYLMKRSLQQEVLVRSLFYAIERQRAEAALREANDVLEDRVQARTAELEEANQQLRQEVANRQQIQERLTLAQEAAQMGTFEWHLASNQIVWSTSLAHNPGGPATDHGWPWMLHPDDRDRVEQELQRAVASGQGLDIEFRILADDRPRWLAIKSILLCDLEGRSERLLGIHMDITDKKQMEAQFLRSQRLESLGTLASGIAHDLNNILTPILLVVQLLPLKLGPLDPWLQSKLNILETSAQRGADLVKQILAFARGVEGKRHALKVHHLLRDIRKLVQQTLPKSIDIYLDAPETLWAVWGDATQLHQVLMNLCVNGRDAMPQGGELYITAENVTLNAPTAAIHPQAHPGPYVVVTVKDTGIGMSPDVLNRIFDPFFTTKSLGQGTGLGLSAALGIVDSHGGFIDVKSQMGEGSQFQVYLPATVNQTLPETVASKVLDGHQALVLVVDDEPAVCAIIETTLELYNYQVLVAHDGESAIARLTEYLGQVDIVLMDLMMPNLDGFTAIAIMKQMQPQLRAIAMSGLNSTAAVAKAEQQGFETFLPKPFTRQDLLQKLQEML
jgi:two-component system cell cycle sensor histidine kinase/response regulator CckA